MKRVLLLGEYSGVHTNLADALKRKGFDVTTIHDGDSYKSFKPDYLIKYNRLSTKFSIFNFILRVWYVFLYYIGLRGVFDILRYKNIIKNMRGYDVVHLINPIFLQGYGALVNLIIFIYLRKYNEKVFLCALGDDYYWVKYCLDKKYDYSMFDRLNIRTLSQYISILQYVFSPWGYGLNKYIASRVNAIIPSLYDYYMPYKSFPNCSEIVPIIMPVKYKKPNVIEYPIKIFHGWQFGKELRKGNDLFDEAIKKIQEHFPELVKYEIVGGLPYSEYIKRYDDCHIFIDQCYSQDSGVNALLGMSNGKVVFSGFENEVKNYYNIDYEPLVNARPDINSIYSFLLVLIKDKKRIEEYSLNALKFIREFHSEDYVVEKYKYIWGHY